MASERVKPACLFLSAAALVASGCGTPPREANADAGPSGRAVSPADPVAIAPTEAPEPGITQAAAATPAPVVDGPVRPDLAPPPGFPAEALTPLGGDALAAATATLAEVRETLPEPIQAAERATGAGAVDDTDPPLQAQRLFGRAQQALLQNDHAEAVQMLEAAARLAPGEPRILAELARGWLALGNRPRGIQHLREAVRLGEGDADARLLLGQLLVDAGEPEAGLAELLAVLDGDAEAGRDADPALRPLAAFQAGRTLVGLGRLDAALQMFGSYRTASREGLRPSRAGAALLELDRGAAGHLVREGDLVMRLGRPEEAAAAYAAAEASIPAGDDGEPVAVRDPQLVARQVFVDLRLGRDSAARERLVDFTNRSNAAPVALTLVSWAVESGLPGGPMVEQLRGLRAGGGGGDPTALALTLAVSLPRDEAIELLRERQAAGGFEPRVYDALLALLLAPDAEPTEADRARAVELVLETLREHPDRGYLATAAWFRRAGGAGAAAADFEATNAAGLEDDAAALTLGTIVEREAAGVGMDAPQQEADAPAAVPASSVAPATGGSTRQPHPRRRAAAEPRPRSRRAGAPAGRRRPPRRSPRRARRPRRLRGRPARPPAPRRPAARRRPPGRRRRGVGASHPRESARRRARAPTRPAARRRRRRRRRRAGPARRALGQPQERARVRRAAASCTTTTASAPRCRTTRRTSSVSAAGSSRRSPTAASPG